MATKTYERQKSQNETTPQAAERADLYEGCLGVWTGREWPRRPKSGGRGARGRQSPWTEEPVADKETRHRIAQGPGRVKPVSEEGGSPQEGRLHLPAVRPGMTSPRDLPHEEPAATSRNSSLRPRSIAAREGSEPHAAEQSTPQAEAQAPAPLEAHTHQHNQGRSREARPSGARSSALPPENRTRSPDAGKSAARAPASSDRNSGQGPA